MRAAGCPKGTGKLQALLADPGDPRHGPTAGQRAGCRCGRCRAEKSEAKARYPDEKGFGRLAGAGEGGTEKSYTAKMVKTYQKEVEVKAVNDKEALRFAGAKIVQGGDEDEILARTEMLIEPAAKSEGSGR